MTQISVIIPAYNEEKSIGKVIAEIPSVVDEIIVVNNHSTDNTAKVAQALEQEFYLKSARAMDMPV